MTGKFALVAGISNYRERWQTLDFCENDAVQVAEILTYPEYDFHVTKLLNEEVTKTALLRWLIEARSSGAKQILFYFAGHGVVTDLGSFLVTSDNQEFDEGISLRNLLSIIEPPAGSETEAVIVLDTCHSGDAASSSINLISRQLSNSDLVAAIRDSDASAAVVAACEAEQSAWEYANLGHGLFTYHLLDAMLGSAADHKGDVTVHSLYDVISRNMENGDNRQRPVFGGRVSGRVVLGQGFDPVLTAPRPEEEYAQIEAEANEHLEKYNRIRTSGSDVWVETGYRIACKKLESINTWFERKETIQGITQRAGFRRAKSTMLRFQSELGVVETGMNTPWGKLERQIGAGGFGKVWLIADGDRKLAYKLYHANELSDKEKVRRFRNGYDAMRMLHHPSIVNVHDYAACPPGFIMDYIEGQNLRELAPGNYMESADILAILLTAAEAIEHAHNNDVIHRDIKPENIVCSLSEDGRYVPSLTDFDLAWFSTQTQRATKTAMGVIYYAAPEQYFSFNPKVARSKTPALDVYSFGQLMYFCLTNKDPDPVNISNNIGNLNRSLFQSCSAEGAKEIIELYENCTRFSPEERIQSFGEVIIALGRIIQGLSHTERDGAISFEQYIGEVAYQMTGHVPQSGATSFTNSARTWAIGAQWKEGRHDRRRDAGIISLHFKPIVRVALENVANERMRMILNRSIDRAIAEYGNRAQRHPGRQGEFEFFLDWSVKSVTRRDALELCEALRKVLASLSY